MAGKIQTVIRTVREITDDSSFESVQDPARLVHWDPCKVKTYRENPYLDSWDLPCQLLGIKDGKVIGRRNSFPSKIVADGTVYDTRISGSVYVDQTVRSSLYAISLLNQALKFPNGDLNINCGLSPQNQKFYRFYGSAMFPFVIFDASGKWSKFYKEGLYTGWKWLAATVLNTTVFLFNQLFASTRWKGLPNWSVVDESVPGEFIDRFCGLIRNDCHRFRVEMTPAWVRWVMNNDFITTTLWKKHLVGIYDGEKLVGFVLYRHEPLRKIYKIYDWQLTPEYEGREDALLAVVARRLYRFGHRIMIWIGEDRTKTISDFKSRFAVVGQNFAVVTLAESSRFSAVPGIRESRNWRIRPSMGDMPFW